MKYKLKRIDGVTEIKTVSLTVPMRLMSHWKKLNDNETILYETSLMTDLNCNPNHCIYMGNGTNGYTILPDDGSEPFIIIYYKYKKGGI
jgi:hypothetical protein